MFPSIDLSAIDLSKEKGIFEVQKIALPQFVSSSGSDRVKIYQVVSPAEWEAMEKKDDIEINIDSLGKPRELDKHVFDMRFRSISDNELPGLWSLKSQPVIALQVRIPFVCRDETNDVVKGKPGDYVMSGLGGFNFIVEKDNFAKNYLIPGEKEPVISLIKNRSLSHELGEPGL